jgi:hypothetical protein
MSDHCDYYDDVDWDECDWDWEDYEESDWEDDYEDCDDYEYA